MRSVDEIEEITKRKSRGLFFLKNKHAISNFKNHEYFQTKSQFKLLKQAPNAGEDRDRWRMFVQEPTSYGLNNTYHYLKNRISPAIESEKHKKYFNTKYSGDTDMHSPKKRVTTQTYERPTANFLHRLKQLPLENSECSIDLSHSKISYSGQKPSHLFKMLYIPSLKTNYKQLSQLFIQLDISSFLIRTFRKCKIHYHQDLTSKQYVKICEYISAARDTPHVKFNTKDLLNMGSVKQVFAEMQRYGEGSVQWREIIKYFFIAEESVVEYHFQKFIDQLKSVTIYNLNAEIHGSEIFIYRTEDRMRIRNIYDLLKPGNYVYGTRKDVFDEYLRLKKMEAERNKFQIRKSRWKRLIGESEPEIIVSKNDQRNKSGSPAIAVQKMNEIFNSFRIKRSKRVSHRSVDHSHRHVTEPSQFLDRTKLQKSQDIFE